MECNNAECIHIGDPDTFTSVGNDVFLGCDSEPKRNVRVTIQCSDRGKGCTEFDRYKTMKKQNACGGKPITPTYNGTIEALRCKEWKQSNSRLICQEDNDKYERTCCTTKRPRSTIRTKKDCKDPKKNDCKNWGSWSAWNLQKNLWWDRSRFCWEDSSCTYLETQHRHRDNKSVVANHECGNPDMFNMNKTIKHKQINTWQCDGY